MIFFLLRQREGLLTGLPYLALIAELTRPVVGAKLLVSNKGSCMPAHIPYVRVDNSFQS